MSNNLRWKRLLGEVYPRLSFTKKHRCIILIYHSVDGGPMSTKIEHFKRQMAWIAENAEVVSLESLLDRQCEKNDKPQVVLTFDDGYRTVHDVVAPILKRYGLPATVYLNSGHIGDSGHELSDAGQGHYPDEEFMTWTEVAHLHDQGWLIGSHGVKHIDLTSQDEQMIEKQLTESKKEVSRMTGENCIHFSYTWGRHTPLVRELVAKAGYQSAVAGDHRVVSKESDLLSLPRLDVRREYTLGDFKSVVKGEWDYLGYYQRLREMM